MRFVIKKKYILLAAFEALSGAVTMVPRVMASDRHESKIINPLAYYLATEQFVDQLVYRKPQTIGTPSLVVALGLSSYANAHGAVGPDRILIACQDTVSIKNKTDGLPLGFSVSLNDFFISVRGSFTASDPRAKYDRSSGRWFVIANTKDTYGSVGNLILLAVSTTTNILYTTDFNYYYITANNPSGVPYYHDYPTLGIDFNALYIGGGSFVGQDICTTTDIQTVFVIKKSTLISSPPASGSEIFPTKFGLSKNQVIIPQGVDNFDSRGIGFFIASTPSPNTLRLIKINNTVTPSVLVSVSSVTVPSFSPTIPVLQPSPGSTLEGLDTRLTCAHIRSGQLWTTHNIGVDGQGRSGAGITVTRNAARWYQINTSGVTLSRDNATLVQSGNLFAPQLTGNTTDQLSYWVPSLMTSGQGHMALCGNAAGANMAPAVVAAGRLATDALGATQSPDTIKQGNLSGGSTWGAYSYTCLDPSDDMTMWTTVQYMDAGLWGVWLAKLRAPPPATPDPAASTANVAGEQPGGYVNIPPGTPTDVTVVGRSVNGSGFFDPGTGFTNRISATISGGGFYSSIQVVSPTQLLVRGVTFSVNGLYTLRINNPDGQASPAVTFFQVGTAGSGA